MSLFALGSLVGALLGGPTSVWAGRRATLVIGVVVSIIGIVLQSSSVFVWYLNVGVCACACKSVKHYVFVYLPSHPTPSKAFTV